VGFLKCNKKLNLRLAIYVKFGIVQAISVIGNLMLKPSINVIHVPPQMEFGLSGWVLCGRISPPPKFKSTWYERFYLLEFIL
jgi:hypothetical protein